MERDEGRGEARAAAGVTAISAEEEEGRESPLRDFQMWVLFFCHRLSVHCMHGKECDSTVQVWPAGMTKICHFFANSIEKYIFKVSIKRPIHNKK